MDVVSKLGLIAFDDRQDLKTPTCYVALGRYKTLELPVGTKYQVTSGKLFVIGKINYWAENSGGRIDIGYGDTSVDDSLTPPTNYVTLLEKIYIEVANRMNELEVYLEFPSGKYPCIKNDWTETTIIMTGKEL